MNPSWKVGFEPKSVLITDKNSSYRKDRASVRERTSPCSTTSASMQSKDQRAYQNTVEAVNAVVPCGAKTLGHVSTSAGDRSTLDVYLNEILWRWNHQRPQTKVRKERNPGSGSRSSKPRPYGNLIPVKLTECEVFCVMRWVP